MKTRFAAICLLFISTAVVVAQSDMQPAEGQGIPSVSGQSAAIVPAPQMDPGASPAQLPDVPDFDSHSNDSLLNEAVEEKDAAKHVSGTDSTARKTVSPDLSPSMRYHWSGLMWQSLAFTGVEDTYRMFTD